jgi:hypothetical protein
MEDEMENGLGVSARPITDIWASSTRQVISAISTPAIPLAYEQLQRTFRLADSYNGILSADGQYHKAEYTIRPLLKVSIDASRRACLAAEKDCIETKSRLSVES